MAYGIVKRAWELMILKVSIIKVTKNKGAFVSDDALIKILYLAAMQISDRWVIPIKNWGNILNELIIYFKDRVKIRY